MAAILWEPSPERVEQSQLRRFQRWLGEQRGVACADTRAMHAWSTTNPGEFWAAVWDFAEVVGERGPALVSPGPAFHQWRFLPEATLNVAQTLLRDPSDEPAMLYRGEDGEAVDLSRAELHALVSRMQQMLRAADVEPGDRVAAMLPNRPEAYALAIAAASVGALFSSVSPDFGVDGALDRFGQIAPKVLVATPGYSYAGTRHDVTAKAEQIAAALPSLVATHLVTPGWLDAWQPAPVGFTPLPFDHPWLVLFSSGTTGKPKCIVHRAGGVLLKHLSEQLLHCDVQPRDRVFYFTTTGWMMFNWLGSALAARAALVLYDGSPVHPDNRVLFDLIDSAGITLFGTSAKFIDGCRKAELRPRDSHDLGTLRTICSTGSVLVPEGFDYVYENVKPDVHLASISGGTDLCGCLVAGNPTAPVRRGEIQMPALGLDMAVVNGAGAPRAPGEQGELVCRAPFPSMPLGFWNDPDGARYRAAYFERLPGVWHHGDFASPTEAGGFVISGRSDATLNPGGVRIGTAEVYRRVEALREIAEAVVIGQEWEGDTRVVLFVVMAEGELDDALRDRIRREIRAGATPRHVPAVIAQVPDIPRTRSGKITELAVREVVHGREVKNTEALANPEALAHFRDRVELGD